MIEADIVYGYLIDDPTQLLQPVMGHPPSGAVSPPPIQSSDISLVTFLTQILNFNKQTTNDKQKGVKLDFKSTDVFQNSLPMLNQLWPVMDYPVWINADIYSGPLNNTQTTPVDAQIFFDGIKTLSNATLSTGWTTRWGSNFTDGSYTDSQVNQMIDGIKRNNVANPITFPVRAGIAAQSIAQLDHLYKSLNDSNQVTFTIWSSVNDSVDVKKLKEMIFHFGIDKVYVDVPEELSDQLRLDVNAGFSLKPNLAMGFTLLLGVFLSMF